MSNLIIMSNFTQICKSSQKTLLNQHTGHNSISNINLCETILRTLNMQCEVFSSTWIKKNIPSFENVCQFLMISNYSITNLTS